MTENRCTGHCCERFNLSTRYAELMSMRLAVDNGNYSGGFLKSEIIKISDMIIPLGKSYLDHNVEPMIAADIGPGTFDIVNIGEIVVHETEWFTCKHYDKNSKNCMNYENRPIMCQKHGCNGCAYKACTLKNKNEEEVKLKELC
jgi:Fe-S-cluster containining protein